MSGQAGGTTASGNAHFGTFRYVATVQTILLVGALAGLTTPVFWGAIVKARGYDIVTFGTMNTINAGVGFLVGTWLVLYLQKLDRRLIIIVCGLTSMMVELATIFAVDKNAFFVVRAFGAGAAGVAGIVGLVYLSYTPSPPKTYAWYVTLQTMVQAIGLFAVPQIAKNFGIDGLLMTQSGIGLCVALLALTLPKIPAKDFAGHADVGGVTPSIPWAAAVPAMFAFLTFGFYTTDFFNYSERFGNARGLDPERIGLILAVTTAAGLPASLLVSWLGDRIGKVIPVLIGGVAGLIASLLLLLPEFGEIGFWVALTVFSLVWSFVYPYLLALFADIDPVGRLLVATQPIREAVKVLLQAGLTAATAFYGLKAAAWLAGLAIVLCPLMVTMALYLNERHKRNLPDAPVVATKV